MEKVKIEATLSSLVQKIIPDGQNTSLERVSDAILLRITELEQREASVQERENYLSSLESDLQSQKSTVK